MNRETVPLDPDWDRYFQYERAGILRIWTARAKGVLVGYVICLVTHGLHHASTVHGYGELFWLAPEWRSGLHGLHLIRTVEQACKKLGVRILRFNTNDTYQPGASGRSRTGVLFVRCGYGPVETVYEKVL